MIWSQKVHSRLFDNYKTALYLDNHFCINIIHSLERVGSEMGEFPHFLSPNALFWFDNGLTFLFNMCYFTIKRSDALVI